MSIFFGKTAIGYISLLSDTDSQDSGNHGRMLGGGGAMIMMPLTCHCDIGSYLMVEIIMIICFTHQIDQSEPGIQ